MARTLRSAMGFFITTEDCVKLSMCASLLEPTKFSITLKKVIGGCMRRPSVDIGVTVIFADRTRLQKHQLRIRRLCEEVR